MSLDSEDGELDSKNEESEWTIKFNTEYIYIEVTAEYIYIYLYIHKAIQNIYVGQHDGRGLLSAFFISRKLWERIKI